MTTKITREELENTSFDDIISAFCKHNNIADDSKAARFVKEDFLSAMVNNTRNGIEQIKDWGQKYVSSNNTQVCNIINSNSAESYKITQQLGKLFRGIKYLSFNSHMGNTLEEAYNNIADVCGLELIYSKQDISKKLENIMIEAHKAGIGTNEFKQLSANAMGNVRKELVLTEKEFPSR